MALLSPTDTAHLNAKAVLGAHIPTRQVRVIETGAVVVVDDRTFDPAVHEALDAVHEALDAVHEAPAGDE